MSTEKWKLVRNNLAVVDYGPVNMTIEAWFKQKPYPIACQAGAKTAVDLLERLSRHLDIAKQPLSMLSLKNLDITETPTVLQLMFESVFDLDEDDFTPMAAVAGTFSDLVKQSALKSGADRVMVNNGGDLSFSHGINKKPFRIGLVSDLISTPPTHTLLSFQEKIQNMGGIATSGMGGRSLTKGVASAVTCFSTSSSKADAAATSVANATACEHPGIKKCPANTLDAMTDLGDDPVTVQVGKLPLQYKKKALGNGMLRAKGLIEKKMISGCFLSVQGLSVMFPEDIAKPYNIDESI